MSHLLNPFYDKDVDLGGKFKVPQILKLIPKNVKEFGILKQTLWNIKNKVRQNQLGKISTKIKIQFIEIALKSNLIQ